MTAYNIYFGTIGKTLGVRYRFTKEFKKDSSAENYAKNAAYSLFQKNEGKFGIPSFNDIIKESELTGLDIEKLYDEHVYDMCRWYIIPIEEDTIPSNKLKWQ